MDDKSRPFTVGGRPLHERLSAELPTFTRLVLDEVTARIPAYELLPAEQLGGDITRVIEQTFRSFIAVLRSRRLPGRDELEFLRESAARRAEEGIPIDIVLTAYHIGIQVVWDSLTRDVRPDEVADVMAINSLALRYLELVTPAVGAGYLDERQTMFDDEHSARQTLLTALLEGTPPEAAAEQAGTRLPPCYLVLAVFVDDHPDEVDDSADPVIAGRRKLRRLRAELDRRLRGPALSSLTPDGGTALLPVANSAAELTTRDWTSLRDTVHAMGKAAGAAITAAVTPAPPAEVATAVAQAREVLRVARAFGKPPAVYRLEDVLLEYQISRPSAALDQLAAILDPLAGSEELLDTLSTFLRHGSRRPAAAELHVHPNTVDYRLRKIHELTGLDPTNLSHVARITAALLARTTSR